MMSSASVFQEFLLWEGHQAATLSFVEMHICF